MTRPPRIRLVLLGVVDTPSPGWTEIVFGPDSGELGVALGALCELPLVLEIELRDGSRVEAVLSEVVCDHLAVRGWDKAALGSSDELTLLPLSSVARVTIW